MGVVASWVDGERMERRVSADFDQPVPRRVELGFATNAPGDPAQTSAHII